MIPIPEMPANPDAWTYFWHQLPYGIPGFLTFITGMILGSLAMYAGLRGRSREETLAIAVGVFCTGIIGLAGTIREVLLDQRLVSLVMKGTVVFTVWVLPAGTLALFHALERKYRFIRYLALTSVPVCIWVCLSVLHEDASIIIEEPGEVLPGTASIRFLYGYGILTMIAACAAGLHFFRFHREEFRSVGVYLAGILGVMMLLSTQAPVLFGYAFPSLSGYIFLPFGLIAYGLLRRDALSLNEFLFERNGFFYIIAILLSAMFLGVVFVIDIFATPGGDLLKYDSGVIFPLLSVTTFFALAIHGAGINSRGRLNIYFALTMITIAFIMVKYLLQALKPPLVVLFRLEQISLMIFAWVVPVSLRYISQVMFFQPPVRLRRIIDVLALCICVFALTPYSFSGYYEYDFGYHYGFSAGISLAYLLAIPLLIAIGINWYRKRKSFPNRLADISIFFLSFIALGSLATLPSSFGVGVYPFIVFGFIPGLLLTYSVLRHGYIEGRLETAALGIRFFLLGLIFVLVGRATYASFYRDLASVEEVLVHALLSGAPMALSIYCLIFVFGQPISEKLDRYIDLLVLEKARAEEAQEDLLRLSDFSLQINATSDLDEAIRLLFAHAREEHGLDQGWFLFEGSWQAEMYSHATTWDERDPELAARLKEVFIPLDAKGSLVVEAYRRKRPLYLRQARPGRAPAAERLLSELTGIQDFCAIPLLLENETVAVAVFGSSRRNKKLTREDLRQLSTFCDQVAGAIHTNRLLERAERYHRQEETERRRASEALEEIRQLAESSKKINATADLGKILDDMHEYFRDHFHLDALWLLRLDPDRNVLHSGDRSLSRGVSEQFRNYLESFELIMTPSESVIYKTCHRRRPFFVSRMDIDAGHAIDRELLGKTGGKSVLLLPLVVRDELRGVLMVGTVRENIRLKRRQIDSIARLAEQIAGSLHVASLMEEVREQKEQADRLLLNVLPKQPAHELLTTGKVTPLYYDSITVLFAQFVNFNAVAADLLPDSLVGMLERTFDHFDDICRGRGLEKLKTVADTYFCAGGLPEPNATHAVDACLAALDMQRFVRWYSFRDELGQARSLVPRIGIHTSEAVAGVIGKDRFAYDIWGDAVNRAASLHRRGDPGEIYITRETYEQVKLFIEAHPADLDDGKAKGEGEVYILTGLKPDYRNHENEPNEEFRHLYRRMVQLKA